MLNYIVKGKRNVYKDIYKELEAIAMKDEHLQDAFTSWVDMSRDSQGLLAYNARLKEVLDEEAFINEAKLREEAANLKLEAKKDQWIKQGLEQGVEQTARRLLKMKMDEKAVAEGTGLTIERVKEIKKEMNL